MVGMTRAVLTVVTASLAIVPLAMLWSSTPPEGTTGTALSLLGGVGGLVCALLFVVRWPTRTQSIAYAVAASGSIAMAALAQSDPTMALLACTAFATISGYIAIFHTAALMVANVTVVVVVPAVPAMTLAATDGVVRALCAYGLILVVNIAVPFGIQILIHALGVDLLEADRDPLTGLLNRRGFYDRAAHLVAAHGDAGVYLVVAMIDLDRFKALNDSQGHAAGDDALIAVGRVLRDHTRDRAVICRVGGEEFVVADLFAHPMPEALGQRLCDAVDALPYPITASIGTASARCDRASTPDESRTLIAALVNAADDVMYGAKRDGGNQVRQQLVECPC